MHQPNSWIVHICNSNEVECRKIREVNPGNCSYRLVTDKCDALHYDMKSYRGKQKTTTNTYIIHHHSGHSLAINHKTYL